LVCVCVGCVSVRDGTRKLMGHGERILV
jgi:hypothetical protein